ncbi:MAG: PKD domain-containing protein [Bacteroidota bacterium]
MKKLIYFIIFFLNIVLLNVNAAIQTNPVIVKIDSVSGSNGAQVILAVRVKNFQDIVAVQGTISFDPTVATYSIVSQFGLSGMNMGNFGLTQISSGKLTFSWSEANLTAVSLADSSAIFSIKFDIVESAGQQTSINLINNPTVIEFVNSSLNAVTVTSTSGKILIPTIIPTTNLTLFSDSLAGLTGSQVIMPIRVKQFNQMLSAQGTITFNQNIASFVSIEQIGLTGMTSADFGTTQVNSGKLMFSWTDATLSGQTLPDSAIIFAIKYTLVGNAGQQSAISFSNTPTPIEFTNTSLNTLAVIIHPGVIKITSTPIPLNLTFKIDSVNGVNGGQVIIPVRVKDFINIVSMQGSIIFDQAVASFVSIQQFGLIGLDSNNFGTNLTSNGKLIFSWFDNGLYGQTLADSTIIFSMAFNLIGNPGSHTNISFSNNPVSLEFIHSNFNSVAVNLINGNIQLFENISISTNILNSDSLCAGQSLSILYTSSGTMAIGNLFTAQLSDAFGGFSNPVNIGSLTSIGSGNITAIIPANTAYGNNYRIRVISSNPSVVGTNNGTNIFINTLPLKPELPTGSSLLCENNPNTVYTISALSNTTSYQWLILPSNAGVISGITNTATVDWTNTFTGNARIFVKGMNACGNGITSDTLNVILNPLASKPSLPSGSLSFCENAANTNYTTNAANALSYLWSIYPSTAGMFISTTNSGTIDWTDNFSGIVKISVKAVNNCGNSIASDSISVTINPLPLKAGTATGTITLCENNSNTVYSSTGSSNATSYLWSISPTNAGTISGTSTSTTIDWNNTYTGIAKISLKGINACGNGIASDTLLVTINPLPLKPLTPSGSASLCQSAPATIYSTAGSTNASSYVWSIYPSTAASISGTTNTATFTWNSIFSGIAKISVKGVNSCGNSIASDSLSITINPIPLKPSTPSGTTSLCENSVNTNYSSTGGLYAYSYLWSIFPASAGTITGTSTTAVVDWTNTYIGTAKISLIGFNSCGYSLTSDSLTVTVNSLPYKPATPAGTITLCENNSNTVYSSTGSSNATSYLWSISPTNAGTISGTSTSTTIDWNNTYTGIAKISLKGINACGNGIVSDTLLVNINPLPLKPLTPSGTASLCQPAAATIYTTNGSTNAVSYLWSIYPSTAASIAGTTNTATISWNSIFSGTAKISVQGVNNCGNGVASDSLLITINPLPLKPSTPTGTTSLCENSINTNYSSTGGLYAYSYLWSIFPASAGTITGTSTTAVVDWTNTYTGTAKISLIGFNSCGNSLTSDSLTVTVNSLPYKPATPAGTITLCENNSNTVYSSTGSSNATSYLWSISPTNAGTISGTSTSTTIDWNNTYTGIAKISLKGINACGNGIASDTLLLTLNPLPLKPTTPSGTASLCQPAAATIYTTNGSTNAISYLWSIYPSTAASIVGTTNTATISWNSIFSGTAKISVKGVNSCGNGVASDSLLITINPLPLKPSTPTGTTSLCENNINSNYSSTGSLYAVSYLWSISPASAGTITGTSTTAIVDWTNTYTGTAKISLIGINACGNSVSSDSLIITISSLALQPGTPTGPTSLSQNSPNSNYTTTGGANASSYQWSISPLSAGTITSTSTIAAVDWTNSFTGIVKISVKGINACGSSISSDSITVIITALPTADFLNIKDTICPGGSDSLYIVLTGSFPWNIVYNNGVSNQNINNISTSPYLLIVNPSISTTYKLVTVSDINWSNNVNDSAKVYIRLLPIAHFTKVINALNVNFTNTSTNASTYSWDFGDGSSVSTLINPAHTFLAFGNYLVVLSATNICGSNNYQDTVKLTNVGIQDISNLTELIIFPNPNNGNFVVKIKGIISDFQLLLYNEIGQIMVKENHSINSSGSLTKIFNVNEYPKGIYLLKIQSQNGILSRKIIIQ